MRVIDLDVRGSDDSFVIECCGFQLTVEDEEASRQLRDLLLEYHGIA